MWVGGQRGPCLGAGEPACDSAPRKSPKLVQPNSRSNASMACSKVSPAFHFCRRAIS